MTHKFKPGDIVLVTANWSMYNGEILRIVDYDDGDLLTPAWGDDHPDFKNHRWYADAELTLIPNPTRLQLILWDLE